MEIYEKAGNSNSNSTSEIQIVTPTETRTSQTTTPEKGWLAKSVITPIAKSILYFPFFREIYNQEANAYNLNTPKPRQLFDPSVSSITTDHDRRRKRKFTTYTSDEDDEMELARSFKLYPPEIQPFSGNTEDWSIWKMNTVTRLGGRGYRKLLFDKEFAHRNQLHNNLLFTLLYEAIAGGNADHIEFDPELQDGYQYWSDLVHTFEGDPTKTAEVVTDLKNDLRDCKFTERTTAATYINNFKNICKRINDQPTQFGFHPLEVRQLFINNIEDPDYQEFARANSSNFDSDTTALIESLLQYDKILRRQQGKYGTRNNNRCLIPSGRPTNRIRRAITSDPSRTGSLPPVLKLTAKGFIQLDFQIWKELSDQNRTFVRTYNEAVKLKTELPSTPSGSTIVEFKTLSI